jgi:hypothetical protein
MRRMDQAGSRTWPGFPERCRLGHQWKPGTVLTAWRPCECETAAADHRRGTALRLLVYLLYGWSPARLGRGVRRGARIAAVHLIVGETHLACGPVVHRGAERLKRGLPSSK